MARTKNRPHPWLISADHVRAAARARYRQHHDVHDILIDADSSVQPAEAGAWVRAWVWVPKEEVTV